MNLRTLRAWALALVLAAAASLAPTLSLAAVVNTVADPRGGANPRSVQVANNTNPVAICTNTCTLYGLYVQSTSATVVYVKIYNASLAGTTCGSGTPIDRIMVPASTSGAGAVIPIAGGVGAAYGTAMTVCVTAGYADNDTTAPAANAYLVSFYTK